MKSKQKSRNWATRLVQATKPKRLPPLKAKGTDRAAPAKTKRSTRCGRCQQAGHNTRTCTNPRVKPRKTRRPAPVVVMHRVLVARREIALRTLQGGERVLHAAYDASSATLQIAFKGTFTVHWYAYAGVPPRVYNKLVRSGNPDQIVSQEIDLRYQKTYVHRRIKAVSVRKPR
jgi:hypothetical protein